MAVNDEDSKIPSDFTKIDRFDFKFRWTIADFLDFPGKTGDRVQSKDFGGDTAYVGVKRRIYGVAYPQGVENEDFLGAYLSMPVTPENAALGLTANYEVSIISFNGQKKFTKRIDRRREYLSQSVGFANFAKLQLLQQFEERFLPNGELTLEYEGTAYIRFNPEICNPEKPKLVKEEFSPESTFDIPKNLWENGTCSDVIIIAGGQDFNCHKCVLSVRSEYFRVMFASGMEESRKRALDFSNQMNGEELKDLLEYLYLGKPSNLNTTCQTLLKVSDLFGLQELKSLSEKALIERLKPDNALELSVLARELGAKNLLKETYLVLAKSVD